MSTQTVTVTAAPSAAAAPANFVVVVNPFAERVQRQMEEVVRTLTAIYERNQKSQDPLSIRINTWINSVFELQRSKFPNQAALQKAAAAKLDELSKQILVDQAAIEQNQYAKDVIVWLHGIKFHDEADTKQLSATQQATALSAGEPTTERERALIAELNAAKERETAFYLAFAAQSRAHTVRLVAMAQETGLVIARTNAASAALELRTAQQMAAHKEEVRAEVQRLEQTHADTRQADAAKYDAVRAEIDTNKRHISDLKGTVGQQNAQLANLHRRCEDLQNQIKNMDTGGTTCAVS